MSVSSLSLEPRHLARRQNELDRLRTARFPELLARKRARMSASPLAFLRGAAPLFYEILAANPDLGAGPEGTGTLQGDAHLENFGAFSPAVQESGVWKKGHATFQLNDFDEATQGSFRWDALRLTTSLILAGRELGQNGTSVLKLCEALLESHSAYAFADRTLPGPPAPVASLIEKVDGRSPKKLLEDRTEVQGGQRHLVRGERYLDVPETLQREVPAALSLFAQRTAEKGGPKPEQLELIDVAFRVAGTGSLGSLRVAALTRGKGGEEGAWLFDLKEQPGSSLEVLVPRAGSSSRAAEVEAAFRACLPEPPRMLGTSLLAGHDVLVRRLTPQEDKLSLARLKPTELAELSTYLGALLGSAHRRARREEAVPWSPRDRSGILERAIALAGLHEAVYLELCYGWRSEALGNNTEE